jgi:hypothetical protein
MRPPKSSPSLVGVTLAVPPEADRRAHTARADKPSKVQAAFPPFDRRFQSGYPVADDPGLVFQPLAPPALPGNELADAAGSGIMLVPVIRETIALAMARTGVMDEGDIVELALQQLVARHDPA